MIVLLLFILLDEDGVGGGRDLISISTINKKLHHSRSPFQNRT